MESRLARLLYNDRAGRQQVLELDPSRRQVVVGRQSDCDIVVHDTSVSRRHCVIVPEEGGFAVVDLGSANGTLVNDVRVTRRRLVDHDVIRCGIYTVQFAETRDDAERAQMTLRDRYRKRTEGSNRAALDRLQALTESQAQRLIQLQSEITRLDGERRVALERTARQDAELIAAREQLHEMQGHLRHLAGALKHREAELATARGVAPEPSSTPPPPPPPEEPPRGMARAKLASAHHALRAQVAQLEAALAAEDAFVQSSRIVPAVDRWASVEPHQRATREARARAAQLQRALDEARKGPPRASTDDRDDRVSELEEQLRVAEKGRRDAEERLARAKARPSVLGPPVSSGTAGVGASKASVFGSVGAPRGGFLSGLGGLGRTAVGSGDGGEEAGGARGRLAARTGSLGRQAERSRQAQLNRQVEERDRHTARIRELQGEVERSAEGRRTIRESVGVLIDRLGALRSGAAGLTALQVAECLDLAATIRDVVD